MTLLYITADRLGAPTGGGQVTFHEHHALCQFAGSEDVFTVSFNHDEKPEDPFAQDQVLLRKAKVVINAGCHIRLAHCYAGCLGETVAYLQSTGCKVTYTVAAHDEIVSREEHERLCGSFPYEHLKDPELFRKYIKGYMNADVCIVPSTHSERVVSRQGRTKPIKRIPHGHTPYTGESVPYPRQFTLGYLGAVGVDKGLDYLLRAWRELNYKDSLLVLAGAQTVAPYFMNYVLSLGVNNVQFKGWVDDVSEFYNSLSAYCQPSATEGFGIEVLESLSHGRPVVCSRGAGAADVIQPGWTVEPRNVSDLAGCIDHAKRMLHLTQDDQVHHQKMLRERAAEYTWDSVYPLYQNLWRSLL